MCVVMTDNCFLVFVRMSSGSTKKDAKKHPGPWSQKWQDRYYTSLFFMPSKACLKKIRTIHSVARLVARKRNGSCQKIAKPVMASSRVFRPGAPTIRYTLIVRFVPTKQPRLSPSVSLVVL